MNRKLLTAACGVLVAILAIGCGKKEEQAVQAPPPPPQDSILIEESTMILCEAEDAAKLAEPFVVAEFAGDPGDESQTASRGKCLEIPRKAGKGTDDAAGATFTFDVPETGEYVFWARVFFCSGCENSFGIEVDGYRTKKPGNPDQTVVPEIVSGNYDPPNWHWVALKGANQKPIRFVLKQGTHTLVVHGTEDGVKMDQFLFTTETDPDKWYPVGIMEP